MRKLIACTAGLAALWMLPGKVEAQAQVQSCQSPALPHGVYGTSAISIANNVITMQGLTDIDLYSSFYYSVESDVFPQGTTPGTFATSLPGGFSATAMPPAAQATPGQSYGVQTNHWVKTTGTNDPFNYYSLSISPQYYSGALSLCPTQGPVGPAGNFWVGTTWATATAPLTPPVISGIDTTTFGTALPGNSGYAIFYGSYLATGSAATQVSIPGIPVTVYYSSSGQVNANYSIPAGMSPGTVTGTLTTAYGSTTFPFTVLRPQTITLAPISNVTYGAAPFNVSATDSSGLTPITYSVSPSTVCTSSGAAVTVVGAGSCSVTASQAGNTTYGPGSATQTFTVAQAGQTITFAAIANQVAGANPFMVTATTTSGLAVSFTATPANVCTVAGSTVTLTGPGSCAVTASQAGNTNYLAATSVTRTFAVGQAQTITFPAISGVTYGASPFAVSATASSGLAVTFTSSPAGVCTVAGSTVTIVGAGSCAVTASQAGNTTYAAATAVVQTFAVARASQGIVIPGKPRSLTVGGASVTLLLYATSGLPLTYTASPPTVCSVSGSILTPVGAGICTVTAQQPGNANYLPSGWTQITVGVAAPPASVTEYIRLGSRTVATEIH